MKRDRRSHNRTLGLAFGDTIPNIKTRINGKIYSQVSVWNRALRDLFRKSPYWSHQDPEIRRAYREGARRQYKFLRLVPTAKKSFPVLLVEWERGELTNPREQLELRDEAAIRAMVAGYIDKLAQTAAIIALRQLQRDRKFTEAERAARTRLIERDKELYENFVVELKRHLETGKGRVKSAHKGGATTNLERLRIGKRSHDKVDAGLRVVDVPPNSMEAFATYMLPYDDALKQSLTEPVYTQMRDKLMALQRRRQPALKSPTPARLHTAERVITAGIVYAAAWLVLEGGQNVDATPDNDDQVELTEKDIKSLASNAKTNTRNRTKSKLPGGSFSIAAAAEWAGEGKQSGKNYLGPIKDDVLQWLSEKGLAARATEALIRIYLNRPESPYKTPRKFKDKAGRFRNPESSGLATTWRPIKNRESGPRDE